MNALDYIRAGLNASAGLSLTLLDDMRDAPMQAPTAKGGNPPHWILGHLAYAESNVIEHIIRGNENPLIEWKGVFGAQQQPGADAQAYPAWDQVRAKFDEVRANTMAFVDGLTEADLETPTKNCPPGREQMFGTVGACLLVLTLHPMMHYGQVADARRMAGRSPIVA